MSTLWFADKARMVTRFRLGFRAAVVRLIRLVIYPAKGGFYAEHDGVGNLAGLEQPLRPMSPGRQTHRSQPAGSDFGCFGHAAHFGAVLDMNMAAMRRSA